MSTIDDARQMVQMSQLPAAQAQTAGPATGGGGSGLGAGDIVRVLKQRKLLIAITFVLTYMLVIGATVALWRFAPLFPGTAIVQYVPPTVDPFSSAEAVLPKDFVERKLNSEASGLTANETLLDLLKQEEIKGTKFYRWYGTDEQGQAKCLEDLKKLLVAAPVRDSRMITVSFKSADKSETTLIINTLVRRYLERTRSNLADEGRSKLNMLKRTQADVETQLQDVRERIANLRALQDMPALESEREVLREVLAMLQNTRSELLARLADITAQLDSIHGTDPRKLPITAEMRIAIEADPELTSYRRQVEQLDVEIRVARRNLLGEEHRVMRLLKSRRDELFQKEAARREELIDNLRNRQYESLQQERARIRSTLAEVQEQITERENQQRDLDAAITQLENLQRDEARYDDELAQVSLRVREAEHQVNEQARLGELRIGNLARDAVLPSRPQPVLYLGGGFVVCLLLGVGVAFLREFTDQKVRTPIDVARHAHLSVLGSVPQLDDEEADIDELEHATRVAPQSLIAEAFRQIRAHLVFSGPIESQRVLLITSPRPEDGKTAVAINLAVTFAQGAQRTLLVDCNFRRPGVRGEHAFPTARTEGLSNVLIQQRKLEEVISPTDIDTLDVISSGPMPPNPAELLGSPQMRALLDDVRQRYDRVILDGPPCLLISDALVIAMQVDATVLVSHAGQNTKGMLRRAREQFQRINARVIGAILNGIKARPGGYFRQQYREFYDYVDEEAVTMELETPQQQLPSDVEHLGDSEDDSDSRT